MFLKGEFSHTVKFLLKIHVDVKNLIYFEKSNAIIVLYPNQYNILKVYLGNL